MMLTRDQVRRRLERLEELNRDMAPTVVMEELLAFLLEILPEMVATVPEPVGQGYCRICRAPHAGDGSHYGTPEHRARALDQTAIYHTRTCPDCIEGAPCERASKLLSGGGK